MFDISFFEIMIISVIGLIVIGPERLPQVARTLGHLMGRCRQFVYSVKTDIHNELRMEELKEIQNTAQEAVNSIEDTMRQEINDIKSTAQLGGSDSADSTNSAETEDTTDMANPTNQVNARNVAKAANIDNGDRGVKLSGGESVKPAAPDNRPSKPPESGAPPAP